MAGAFDIPVPVLVLVLVSVNCSWWVLLHVVFVVKCTWWMVRMEVYLARNMGNLVLVLLSGPGGLKGHVATEGCGMG